MNMPVGRQQFTDGNGSPLVGGSVAFCQPGSGGATFLPVWADEAQTTPLTNPVPLDASGMPFSGGSQVSIWGSGNYEQFVRDADGNLIYSTNISANVIVNNNLVGPVRIQGDLSVMGSITDTQSLTTPQINGTNATYTGQVNIGSSTIGSLTASSGFTSNGGATINGNTTVNGAATITGQLSVGGISSSQDINLNGLNLDSVGTIGVGTVNATTVNTDNLNVSSSQLFRVYGGSATTGSDGNVQVNFPAAFNSLAAVVVSHNGSLPNVGITTNSWSNTGFNAYSQNANVEATPNVSFFWVAVGN